jgi:hypothetical protein
MKPKREELDWNYLRSILYYGPETGYWWWLKSRLYNAVAGQRAGTIEDGEYQTIQIDNVSYQSARLAFFYMNRYWPPHDMDHINKIRADDRWDNLRPATTARNMWNIGPHKDNTSGYKGVIFERRNNKWYAQIMVISNRIHLGTYDTAEEAARAYDAAAIKYHGEFAYLNFPLEAA